MIWKCQICNYEKLFIETNVCPKCYSTRWVSSQSNQVRRGKKMNREFDKNMKCFGTYEPLVRKWCTRHFMVWVMPEFKELFDDITKLAKTTSNVEKEKK